jgi:hypothetical protein
MTVCLDQYRRQGHSLDTRDMKRALPQAQSEDELSEHQTQSLSNINNLDDDAMQFGENATGFFDTWILNTIHIFAPTGRSVHSRKFWRSQMRFELDHRLWRAECLGREATENELEWFVETAIKTYWPSIEMILCRLPLEKQSNMVASAVDHQPTSGSRTKKSQQIFELKDSLTGMRLYDEEEVQQSAKTMNVDWDDLEGDEVPRHYRGEKMKRYGDIQARLKAPRATRRILDGLPEDEAEEDVDIV